MHSKYYDHQIKDIQHVQKTRNAYTNLTWQGPFGELRHWWEDNTEACVRVAAQLQALKDTVLSLQVPSRQWLATSPGL
jgi:hypothetical protein